jgi:outer membrane protein assembly factor BamB
VVVYSHIRYKITKMKMLSLSIFFAFFSFLGCKKPVPIEPIKVEPTCLFGLCDTSKLEIVWQRPLSWDTAQFNSTFPVTFENNVLYTRYSYGEAPDTIKQYNKINGELNWTWANYANYIYSISGRQIFLAKDKFYFTTAHDVYSLNANNGSLEWQTIMPDRQNGGGDPFLNITNNKLYHVHEKRVNSRRTESYLVRSELTVGKWDTLFTQPTIDSLEADIKPPISWQSPQGDEILIFQIRYINRFTIFQKTDVVAYNVNKKTMYFKFENVDPYQTGSVVAPYLLKDKVYVPLNRSVVCFDLLGKTKLWEKEFGLGGHFLKNGIMIYCENKFFVKPSNNKLFQLNPDTGAEIWVDNTHGEEPSALVYYDGLLYYTADGNGKIYAMDVASGKNLWSEKSPNKISNKLNGNRQFSNANIGFGGISIDPKLGYLYTSDTYFAMCLKLPKR